jgi:hypothetical protein
VFVILHEVMHIHKFDSFGDHIGTIKTTSQTFFLTFTRDKSKGTRNSRRVWHMPADKRDVHACHVQSLSTLKCNLLAPEFYILILAHPVCKM